MRRGERVCRAQESYCVPLSGSEVHSVISSKVAVAT